MRAFLFLFLILYHASGQDLADVEVTEEVLKLIQVCDVCTCSEIPDIDGNHLVLNILCTELDKIQNVADLEKIAWPANPNGLKISASFEGLGLTTLGKLPPNSQVESLRFTNNAIKTYWPDPFSDVPNLKKLSFSQNDLLEVTRDLFTKIENLEDLDLSYNKISELNAIDFKLLHNVKKLNLQSNQLKRIPLEALHPMTSLEDLDLSKNAIYDLLLQKENNALSGLKRLGLNGNRIRSVMKDSFPADNKLELLDLSNNIIEIVEEDAFNSCANLRELNLAQNNITFVFNLPSTLQIAILKVNTLYHWPKFPGGIKYIDMSYNRLSAMFDENTASFDSLEVLNIGGNQIKELNIEKKLPKLYILDLSYNLLAEVPKTLSSQLFPNLEDLHLDGNVIQNIYFKNIIALRNLYMTDLNKLRVVEDKAFSNVVGREGEGEKELSCFYLHLSNCPFLSEIKDGAFDGTSVCMLDISKNNLTFLSERLLDWSVLTEGVNLQWNPWECSCDLQWVVDRLLPIMYSANSRLLAELRCGSPRPFEGLRLVHWYNWTDQAMCNDAYLRSGNYMLSLRASSHSKPSVLPSSTVPSLTNRTDGSTDRGYEKIEPSSEPNPLSRVSSTTLILGGCIIIALLITIALTVYLVKTRREYRVRQAAMRRKRQSAQDEKHTNGKEHFTALNKT